MTAAKKIADGLSEAPEPIVLIAENDPERKPKLFACGSCGNAYSVKQVGIQNARDMAINCKDCRPKQYCCDMCGAETPQYWTRCGECRAKVKIEAAEEIPDDGGPYFEFGGDRFYHDIESAEDDDLEWVCPCTETYPALNAEQVLENLLDDMHEDASIDDMDGVTEFFAAVEAFNKAQTTRSFWGDESRKIRVPVRAALGEGE